MPCGQGPAQIGKSLLPQKPAMTTPTPPTYPKGDLRRMLMVLGAIDEAGEATLVQIATRTGLDNKTVSDLIAKAQEQAGVVIAKTGAKYSITDFGPVLKKKGVNLSLRGALNAL